MKHLLIRATLAAAIALTLTGCTDFDRAERDLNLGRECYKAGGNWLYGKNDSRPSCTFMQPQQPTVVQP